MQNNLHIKLFNNVMKMCNPWYTTPSYATKTILVDAFSI
jgi:hypothetical protein